MNKTKTFKNTVLAILLSVLTVFTVACGEPQKSAPSKQPKVTTDSIQMYTFPQKTVYTVGEVFEIAGASVTIKYSDGSTENVDVTADMVSGYDGTTAGPQYITVAYKKDGVTHKTAFRIDVKEKPPVTPDPIVPNPPGETDPPEENDEYVFTYGDEYCWNITETDGITSFESLSDSQFLMFKNKTFTGGSVSFKLKVTTNDYTYSVASGILFGSDTMDAAHNVGKFYVAGRDKWNDYLVFSKDNGQFAWQDSTKIANILTDLTKTYDLKFVWESEKDIVYYFIDGEYVGKQQLNKGFKGRYLGLYADSAGVTVSDIVIDEDETFVPPPVVTETEDYKFTVGDSTNWKITGSGDDTVFESKKSSQFLMFKNKTFTGGSVSFKLKVTTNEYTFSVASGILFGSDTINAAHNVGKFYVAGRDKWNDYVIFAKDNGQLVWQDSTKIANILTDLNKTYDLKFVWNSENDIVYYFIDGEHVGKQQLNKGFKGQYMGIYADSAGVTISDIVIDENETYEEITEKDEYLFTEGDATNWNITGSGEDAVFESTKNSQLLMFKNRTFTGGSVSFKLTDKSNNYTYALVNGIVFAADMQNASFTSGKFYAIGRDKWNDLVMSSRTDGAHAWEDSTKIAGGLNVLGKTYDLKFVWDSENDIVYYFIGGDYVGSQQLTKGYKGEYIGICADSADTVISNIVIDENETFVPPQAVTETEDYKFTIGDSTNWKISGSGENAVFEAKKNSQFLMFKNKTFTGGSVSFKLKVESNDYTYSVASGILFGSDTMDAAHNVGKFYVAGRDKWNDYLVFSKDNGQFAWQDSTKIANILTDLTKTYDLKFVWESEKDIVYYFIDGEYVGKQQLNKGFKGQYIGLYADSAGVTISEIVIDENETYVPEENRYRY